jgi:hypothetical protein
MLKYVFREPLTIQSAADADPQKIGEALAGIAKSNKGELTPPAVVDAARDKKSPLHRHFEWDDNVAANKYRLDQARSLIRSIHVEDDDAEDGHAAAFISISDKGGTAYRTLGEIKGSADLQAKVLAAAERDLDAWTKRYRALKDVCAIVEQAKTLVERKRARAKQEDSRASI